MEYLNLETKIFQSVEFIQAEPVQRATWISLLGWCAKHTTGGRVTGARHFKDRMWQQLAGVTLKEVESTATCTLIQWDGDDIVVWAYPVEQEERLRAKREAGRIGGASTSEAKTQAARGNGGSKAQAIPQAEGQANTQAQTQATGEAEPKQTPNVREGKVKERKGRESARGAPPAPDAQSKAEPQATWLARLASVWPGIDIVAQLKLAEKNRRKADKPFERRWFEEVWLPKCSEPVDTSAKAAPEVADPEGWQAWIVAQFPQASCPDEFRSLPADVQRECIEALSQEAGV